MKCTLRSDAVQWAVIDEQQESMHCVACEVRYAVVWLWCSDWVYYVRWVRGRATPPAGGDCTCGVSVDVRWWMRLRKGQSRQQFSCCTRADVSNQSRLLPLHQIVSNAVW